ncbi:MAG: hypothetical protein ACKO9H_10745, partial [Planctomycetota bacterium]
PATLPLELERLEERRLREDYIEQLIKAKNGDEFAKAWAAAVIANGDVPVLGFGADAVAEITQFSAALLELAQTKELPLAEHHSKDLSLSLDDVTLAGTIERCYPDADNVTTIVLVRPDAIDTGKHGFLVAKSLAALQLLALKASDAGASATALVMSKYKSWRPTLQGNRAPAEDVVQVREI